MSPPGTANSSLLVSAKREEMREKMGTHFTFPSASCWLGWWRWISGSLGGFSSVGIGVWV